MGEGFGGWLAGAVMGAMIGFAADKWLKDERRADIKRAASFDPPLAVEVYRIGSDGEKEEYKRILRAPSYPLIVRHFEDGLYESRTVGVIPHPAGGFLAIGKPDIETFEVVDGKRIDCEDMSIDEFDPKDVLGDPS